MPRNAICRRRLQRSTIHPKVECRQFAGDFSRSGGAASVDALLYSRTHAKVNCFSSNIEIARPYWRVLALKRETTKVFPSLTTRAGEDPPSFAPSFSRRKSVEAPTGRRGGARPSVVIVAHRSRSARPNAKSARQYIRGGPSFWDRIEAGDPIRRRWEPSRPSSRARRSTQCDRVQDGRRRRAIFRDAPGQERPS